MIIFSPSAKPGEYARRAGGGVSVWQELEWEPADTPPPGSAVLPHASREGEKGHAFKNFTKPAVLASNPSVD